MQQQMHPGGGFGQQPGIILLREGTDTSQGKPQLISNINACGAVVDAVRSTLGPRGMDKLMYDGQRVLGLFDQALLDIVHPAARVLAEISMSQDSEVGDGTTSVVLLGGEILKQVKTFVEDGLHPQAIVRGVRRAAGLALERLAAVAVTPPASERRKRLEILASTALNSKLIANYKTLFAPMVVDAILSLDERLLDLSLVGVKKVAGGSVMDSFIVQGVAFKKTFAYAGFEQQPKNFADTQILLLHVELELKSEKENAEVRITDPDAYQSIVDAEWTIIYEKLENCVKSGANVVLSRLPIGDLATQYFADRGIFCAGRVGDDDMRRVSKATGGVIQTSVLDLERARILGRCAKFEETQVGGERYNLFTGCPAAKTATIVLRGGSEQFIEESHRSIHDALMIVKRGAADVRVVGGGGAIEMELSKHLREAALSIAGKDQLVVLAFAKALEIIPRQLALNSGFDATDVLNALRQQHDAGVTWAGVNCDDAGGVIDTFAKEIWEPMLNKANSLAAAAEAACVILGIDETVRNPRSQDPGAADSSGVSLQQQQQRTSAAMGGRGMAGMMGRGGRGVRRLK